MVELNGKPLSSRDKGEYLGVSLRRFGVAADRLPERFNTAMTTLLKIMRITKAWHTTFPQLQAMVKTSVFSVKEYVMYLQPLSETLCNRVSEIEFLFVQYVTGVNVKPREVSRAMMLTKRLPLRHRRCRQQIKKRCQVLH